MTHPNRAIALRLIQETIDFYYKKLSDDKYEEIPGRRSKAGYGSQRCLYKGENGERCAASRLNPEAAWLEDHAASERENIGYSIEGLEKQGMQNDGKLLTFMEHLQTIHDGGASMVVFKENAAIAIVNILWPEEI